MDGMNAIVEHILGDAREKVAQIEAEAAGQAAEILSQADLACERIQQESDHLAEISVTAVINRATSQAALESRRAALATRQFLIEQVIESAVESLSSLGADEKGRLYTDLLKSIGSDHGQVTVNAKDQDLMRKLIDQLDGQFELLDEPGSFTGGLLLSHGRIVENLTFDLLVRNKRPQLAALAAGILFPGAD